MTRSDMILVYEDDNGDWAAECGPDKATVKFYEGTYLAIRKLEILHPQHEGKPCHMKSDVDPSFAQTRPKHWNEPIW